MSKSCFVYSVPLKLWSINIFLLNFFEIIYTQNSFLEFINYIMYNLYLSTPQPFYYFYNSDFFYQILINGLNFFQFKIQICSLYEHILDSLLVLLIYINVFIYMSLYKINF